MYKCKTNLALYQTVETVKVTKHEKRNFEGIANAKQRYILTTYTEEKWK